MLGRKNESYSFYLLISALLVLQQSIVLAQVNATSSPSPDATPTPSPTPSQALATTVKNQAALSAVGGVIGAVSLAVIGLIIYFAKDQYKRSREIAVSLATQNFHKKIVDALHLDYAIYKGNDANSDGKAFTDFVDTILKTFRRKSDKKLLIDIGGDSVFLAPYARQIAAIVKQKFEELGHYSIGFFGFRNQLNKSSLTDERTLRDIIARLKGHFATDTLIEFAPLGNIREQLYKVYREKYSTFTYLFRDDQRVSIADCFINLSIIKDIPEQLRRERLIHPDGMTEGDFFERLEDKSQFDNILFAETTGIIKPEEIAARCNNRPLKILALGAAGIGKSIFCQKAAYQATEASQTWFPSIELVIWIPLRSWSNSVDSNAGPVSIYEYLKKVYQLDDYKTEEIEALLKKNKEHTLWLLDGYDEIYHLPEHHILKRDLYSLLECQYLMTSRPGYDIEGLQYNLKLSIVGFLSESSENFVKKYFSQNSIADTSDTLEVVIPNALRETDKVSQVIDFLAQHPGINGIAHIPIMLDLICLLAKNDLLTADLYTMTQLYERVIQKLSEHYLKRKMLLSEFRRLSMNQVIEQCKGIYIFLASLGFNGIKKRKIILSSSLLEQADEAAKIVQSTFEPEHALTEFGLLRATSRVSLENNSAMIMGREYHFLHLSFQEFFAAKYIVNKIKEALVEHEDTLIIPASSDIANFILAHKCEKGMYLVLKFVAGILSQEPGVGHALNAYFKLLFKGPDKINDFADPLLLSCLHEIKADSRIVGIEAYQENIFYYLIFYHIADYIHLNDLTTNLSSLFFQDTRFLLDYSLAFSSQAKEHFERKIDQYSTDAKVKWLIIKSILGDFTTLLHLLENKDIGSNDLNMLAVRLTNVQISAIFVKLLYFIKKKYGLMGSYAIEILCKLKLSETQTNTAFDILTNLADRLNEDAISALGSLNLTDHQIEKVFIKLVNFLYDSNKTLWIIAIETLCKLKLLPAQTNIVFEKLLTLLSDPDINIQATILTAFGKLALIRTQIDIVFTKLLSLLGGEYAAQFPIFLTIGKLNLTEGQNEQILRKLLGLIEEGNNNIKHIIEYAFATLKLTEDQTTYAMNRLLILTNNTNLATPACVVLGLSKLRLTKDQTNSVLQRILALTDNENSDTRTYATKALGNLALVESQISQILEALLQLIKHADRSTRAAASDVISKLKLTDHNVGFVVDHLSILLGKNFYARYDANKALSNLKLMEHHVEQILKKFLELTYDTNASERSRAITVINTLKLKGVQITQALERFIILINDESSDIRSEAAIGISKLRLAEDQVNQVLEKLLTLIITDVNPVVQSGAASAIISLKLFESSITYVLEKLFAIAKSEGALTRPLIKTVLNQLNLTIEQKRRVGSIANAAQIDASAPSRKSDEESVTADGAMPFRVYTAKNRIVLDSTQPPQEFTHHRRLG